MLEVSGVDMMDGTPIYDIKPYLPYADSYPDAAGGFGAARFGSKLTVYWEAKENVLTAGEQEVLTALLAEDPRPSYQEDPTREYGFFYGNYEIRFRVADTTLFVTEVLVRS